ncbi:MAG: hypothetical protein H5T41_00825 [Methanomassiliicoccales archaeon]|nr:hypothetical protein [Methanomassiliicoccales archaeon]
MTEKDETLENLRVGSDVLIGEKLMARLEKTMEEHGYQRSALLEVLQKAQEIFGYLDRKILILIAEDIRDQLFRFFMKGIAYFSYRQSDRFYQTTNFPSFHGRF